MREEEDGSSFGCFTRLPAKGELDVASRRDDSSTVEMVGVSLGSVMRYLNMLSERWIMSLLEGPGDGKLYAEQTDDDLSLLATRIEY